VDADPRSLARPVRSQRRRGDLRRAKPLYEQAIQADPDAQLIRDYGYLLECF